MQLWLSVQIVSSAVQCPAPYRQPWADSQRALHHVLLLAAGYSTSAAGRLCPGSPALCWRCAQKQGPGRCAAGQVFVQVLSQHPLHREALSTHCTERA